MDRDSYIQNMAMEISFYRNSQFIEPLGDFTTQKDRVLAKEFTDAQLKDAELTIFDWCQANISNPFTCKDLGQEKKDMK